MKLMFAEQKSALSAVILSSLGANSESFKYAKPDDLKNEVDDDDICVVVKSVHAEEVCLRRSPRSQKMEERLQAIMFMVGIPPNIKGFKFLKDAVKNAIVEPEIINHMTKSLYPKIAEANMTTASKVERAIRHAIEVSWQRGKIENINSLFGIKVLAKTEKPTNGELIALIADKILVEIGA